MLRLCFSGGFRRFLPITLEEVSIMSRYYHHQQRNIRTTIPSFYLYREISKIMEDESIGIKSSTRVVTRADCVCESLKDVVDLSETLDCCPFRKKELNYKLADGEMCRLCQVEDTEIPEILLELAWQVFFDWQDRLYEFDEDYYEVTKETAELAQAAVSLSLKKFALAYGIKLTTLEELTNFANFFFVNTELLCYWKGAECVYIDYYSGHINHIHPNLRLDKNPIHFKFAYNSSFKIGTLPAAEGITADGPWSGPTIESALGHFTDINFTYKFNLIGFLNSALVAGSRNVILCANPLSKNIVF